MTQSPEFERLAFEAALRGLDKQEGVLEELRARTGVLLGASALAAAFLGQEAFRDPSPAWLVIVALSAFIASILASVYILMPKRNLIFAESGAGLYEGLYAVREDLAEVYRRLAYDLDRFWESNDETIVTLVRTYRVAAGARSCSRSSRLPSSSRVTSSEQWLPIRSHRARPRPLHRRRRLLHHRRRVSDDLKRAAVQAEASPNSARAAGRYRRAVSG